MMSKSLGVSAAPSTPVRLYIGVVFREESRGGTQIAQKWSQQLQNATFLTKHSHNAELKRDDTCITQWSRKAGPTHAVLARVHSAPRNVVFWSWTLHFWTVWVPPRDSSRKTTFILKCTGAEGATLTPSDLLIIFLRYRVKFGTMLAWQPFN